MRSIGIFAAIVLVMATPRLLQAEARVETNVIYGMYSGSALLMDVYYPENPNGIGIVFIMGSGWHAPSGFDAEPLKAAASTAFRAGTDALLSRGYTMFSLNHRSAPTFRYPIPVDDAQRATRFIRHNASLFGIDEDRLGAVGGSSGGHLASLLGVLDGTANLKDSSAVNRESSKVQAVVAFCPATDLLTWASSSGGAKDVLASFIGTSLSRQQRNDSASPENRLYRQASTNTHISPDDAPVLLIHGDEDAVVPFAQSVIFRDGLAEAGIAVEFIEVPGGGHCNFMNGPDADQYYDAMSDWFDLHLREL